MYVEPSTNIRILKGVPLDNSYTNTLYFENATAQYNYFSAQTKHLLTNYSFIRAERGQMLVKIGVGDLYDCSYLMYQNSSFSSRWFYAFITSVEYVNNNTTRIYFEIDTLQTWYFDWSYAPCYIERTHTPTDNIGDNVVPENLELGDYIMGSGQQTSLCTNPKICIAATFYARYTGGTGQRWTLKDAAGHMYGGVYSGITFNYVDTEEEANEIIEQATADKKQDGIVAIFMVPAFLSGNSFSPPDELSYSFGKPVKGGSIDGYTPKNSKLFTYPYSFLYVTDNSGNAANYKYEYFSSNPCVLRLAGDISSSPAATLYPVNYKGIGNNYNESMTLGGFPQCAYNVDSYKAWLAQSGASWGVGLAGSVATSIGGLFTGNPFAVVGGLGGIVNSLQAVTVASAQPPQARGNSSSSVQFANKFKEFYMYPTSIRAEFARIIDNFFTMYGYAVHECARPVTKNRPRWTYIKTIDCQINNVNAPSDEVAKAKQITDKGITYWVNAGDISNYSLDNGV